MNSQFKAANIFSDVKVQQFPRHLFDLSYTNSFTCNHGKAIPFFVDDVRPGDKIDLNSFGRIQLQPLATATLQNLKVYFRFFYVPLRLLWDKWDKFISQDGFVETPLIAPYSQLNSANLNSLAQNPGGLSDMLGLNVTNVKGIDEQSGETMFNLYEDSAILQFNIFRFLAYSKIWDTYFRDENLQDVVTPDPDEVVSGYNSHATFNLNTLLPVAYEKDYFTTALPWTQKGEPINLSNYVQSLNYPDYSEITGRFALINANGSINRDIDVFPILEGDYANSTDNNTVIVDTQRFDKVNWAVSDADASALSSKVRPGLMVGTLDPKNLVTQFSINELRYANALQRYLERLALGGNRPAEFYLSMYGVKVDDLRIGNPLYLGGGSTYVNVTPVTQQARSADEPMGSLAGNGTSSPSFGIDGSYYCQEFGIVMGIMYIRPELNYKQGICKELQLYSHLDFYNPIFAHLGEEPVMKSELYLKSNINNTTTENNNDDIFGYQSRYAYLKHKRNEVHGELKTSLSHWLLADNFNNSTALNDEFITVQQNYDIFAIIEEDEHHYICEIRNKYMKESNMPDFSIPSL